MELFYFFATLLGIFIGSFLNVLVVRHNTGVSAASGRSFCFSCGHTLSWTELVPVVSFIAQRGRCAHCKSKVSLQYPVVEVLSGISFFLVVYTLEIPETIAAFGEMFYWLIVFSVLLAIAAYDVKHKIIPDAFVFFFIFLAFGHTVFFESFSMTHLLAGPALFAPFAFLWFVSRGTWMGFGDAKLAWGIGWLLGLSSGAAAITFAFWIGAITGILLLFASHTFPLFQGGKHVTMKSEIPFGPFLILGIYIVFVSGIDFSSIIAMFS